MTCPLIQTSPEKPSLRLHLRLLVHGLWGRLAGDLCHHLAKPGRVGEALLSDSELVYEPLEPSGSKQDAKLSARRRLRVQEEGSAHVLDTRALDAIEPPDLVTAQGEDASKGEVGNPGHSPHSLAHLAAICIPLVDPGDNVEDDKGLEGDSHHHSEHAMGTGSCRNLLVLCIGSHGPPEDDGGHQRGHKKVDESARGRQFGPPAAQDPLRSIQDAAIERQLPIHSLAPWGNLPSLNLQCSPQGRAHHHHDYREGEAHDNGHSLQGRQ